ncbi:MAG: Unknown protein [uncultured Sulfurovum sp.]|uniref:Uncharacterized protein n=1 Tax=uncultured Sulfurovum sp. TaxID=269237 RepID=A0A6S6SKZ3_9BACT|nr:MAG: Unknown protein [uncultured Sulfurovum sp.]
MIILDDYYYFKEEVLMLFEKEEKETRKELKQMLELVSFNLLSIPLVDRRLLDKNILKYITPYEETLTNLNGCANVSDFVSSTSMTPPSCYKFYPEDSVVHVKNKAGRNKINSDEIMFRIDDELLSILKSGKHLFFLGSREINKSKKYTNEEKKDFESFVILENMELGRKFYFGVW